MPSNLGKGIIWYFLCPKTNNRCRKLYLVDGLFLHREAFTGCMYESQTVSKKYRQIEKKFGAYFDSDILFEQLHKKYFKRTYKGKLTKRFLRIESKLKRAESLNPHEIEALYYL